MNRLSLAVVCIVAMIILIGCDNPPTTEKKTDPADLHKAQGPPADEPKGAVLTFSIELNRRVYEYSDYGEPPQIAIWLESPNSDKIRTVWVTYRKGAGVWAGKTECAVALPYWVSRYNRETQTSGPPTFRKPVIDAITGPTPKQSFNVDTRVAPGSRWKYFIEVNVSGDFNVDFPSALEDGTPDPQGNGQPSLIYQGNIEAVKGANDVPVLIGRTDQWQPIDYIISDLKGITNAKDLFTKVKVFCQVHCRL